MRHTIDHDLRGHVLLFDGIQDVTATAEKTDPAGKMLHQNCSGESMNCTMPFNQWADVQQQCKDLWPQGLETVQEMLEEIRAEHLPPPSSTRRVRRWSEIDGEVDADRVIGGEPAFMRESCRAIRRSTTSVILMCNTSGSAMYSNTDLLWKCAAAVATMDLMEDAGYSCEVWGWKMCSDTYKDFRHPHVFSAFKLKEAGDAVDVDLLAKGLSPWFARTAFIESQPAAGPVTGGYGRPRGIEQARPWAEKHMDFGTSKVVWAPIAYSREEAIAKTKSMIADLETLNTGEQE